MEEEEEEENEDHLQNLKTLTLNPTYYCCRRVHSRAVVPRSVFACPANTIQSRAGHDCYQYQYQWHPLKATGMP